MSVVTLWPDLSVSSLDATIDSGFQTGATWQPTTGSPAGVFPRVLCTGTKGITAPNTPTNASFSLYMVGTFDEGYAINAEPDVGGWALAIDSDGKIHANVWASAFDLNTIVSDDPIPNDSALILGLAFDKLTGHFNFSVNGDLVPAHLNTGGAPTASGFSDNACNPNFTIQTYDAWIGKSPSGDGGAAFNQLIMWDRYHTAPQRAQVVTFLTTKWGL